MCSRRGKPGLGEAKAAKGANCEVQCRGWGGPAGGLRSAPGFKPYAIGAGRGHRELLCLGTVTMLGVVAGQDKMESGKWPRKAQRVSPAH